MAKVIQGHRQCHRSIERIRCLIHFSYKLCNCLAPFSRSQPVICWKTHLYWRLRGE